MNKTIITVEDKMFQASVVAQMLITIGKSFKLTTDNFGSFYRFEVDDLDPDKCKTFFIVLPTSITVTKG